MKKTGSDEYRFILDPRRGSACKTTCPSCGQKKCFKYYIDTLTNKPIDESCGRCDHEQACGYHLTPRELFSQRPDIKEELCPNSPHGASGLQVIRQVPAKKEDTPPPPVVTFPMWMVEERHRPDVNFWNWLNRHINVPDIVSRAFDDYRLGTTRTGIYKNQPVIFWYININNVVCEGKIIWFKPNGHRENWVNCISSRMKTAKKLPEEVKILKCFFGEHLLSQRPDAWVFIVESEKTAVFMSCLLPQFIWLATGGCNNLNADMLSVLKGRIVWVIPDCGKHDDWYKILSEAPAAKEMKYVVASKGYDESYPKNTDLVDIQLGEVRPILSADVQTDVAQIVPPVPLSADEVVWRLILQDNTELQELSELFGLEFVSKSPLKSNPFERSRAKNKAKK